ncbi:MAG: putative integral membrane protein conserved region-domain-containing protein, partial [Benjaminiella poitrasii]
MPLAHTLLPRSYFAVLKLNTLYLYDSELQLECKETIQVNQYTVQIYPDNLKDHELFSKSTCIQLKCNDMTHCNYLLNCNRCVTKEDWYFALIRASQWNLSDKISNKTATHFDQEAMNHLLSTVYSSPRQFELRWFNGLLGRLFLGIYRTETTQSFFYNKILSKVQKLNARRPPFLEEITLRSVDSGHGAPQITQPRLVQLSPQGEYTGEVQLFYDGHFRVELETVLRWKYSERLPAIRIDLVLAITLRSIEGRLMVKLKEPPTNRVWLGFYEKPRMDWLVEPVVWEKRVGYSVVSKAIQAKIEEIFTETIVLPNMDDTVFFPTDGAGGIFDSPHPDYQSLPELYSTPSELVVTSEPVSLVSSDHQLTPPPIKKKWFKRN